jgi:3-hydroxyacyl-[acyl-carrier-protein] dehydratase
MKFDLIDRVLEQTDGRIVAVKHVTQAEEYLQDHFPTFPVLPGVMMVETMVQAARRMLAGRGDPRLVLGAVQTLKFASFVRPGEMLVVEVSLMSAAESPDGAYTCRGTGRVHRGSGGEGETAVTGRFTMRPIRSPRAAVAAGPQRVTRSR